jgi:hypothetical protein
VADGVPVLEEYFHRTRDKRRTREVHIADGALVVVKNGAARDPRAPLPGLDLLSALFIYGRCDERVELHTGRRPFLLERLAAASEEGCRYQVTDEDEDTYTVDVRYGLRDGVRVPVVLEFSGMLSARIVLREPSA